jgi:NAD(P)-dependent dehydrogenase (short-subunit alcohol dehydrogenase family)
VESFEGRIAVVTGGGTGMGRELVVQLAAEGCHVAACDVNPETLEEMADLARAGAPEGTLVTTHICDVSDAMAMDAFRDEVLAQHDTNHVNLVFNNAGIAGGGSFVMSEPKEWDLTFGVCWGGVYNGCRSFLPLLIASDSGYLVNTSSVNGFWATLGLGIPHTAYSAAKFAVKGLTEALLEDFRMNAPHVAASVVMPGHIGTDIVNNSRLIHVGDAVPGPDDVSDTREAMRRRGVPVDGMDDEAILSMMQMFGDMFRDNAPTSAAEAATVILDGVRENRWRILIGDDARKLDEAVRANPEHAYDGGVSLGTLGLDAG